MNELNKNSFDREINHLIGVCNGKAPSLFHLRLLLTNRCNLKCPFCVSHNREIDYSKEVSDEKYLLCIKDAINLGLKHLKIIGGGEALLRKNLLLKIIKIKKKNPQVFCDIHTNGTLFSDDLIKNFVDSKWGKIAISIEGPNAKTNDPLRGKGTFDKIITTLERFNHWKKLYKTNWPELNFGTVLTSKNYNKIDKLLELAHKNGVTNLHLQSLFLATDFCQNLKLSNLQIDKFQEKLPYLIKMANELKIRNNFDNFSVKNIRYSERTPGKIIEEDLNNDRNTIKKKIKVDLLKSFCLDFWNYLMISPAGDIQFCLKKFEYGFNIKKDRLHNVWHGTKLKNIRKKFLEGNRFRECDICCPGKIFENLDQKKAMYKKMLGTSKK
jgi:MoaA/NifB/PqqE/SkfB family radical SAM enzyme